MKIIKPDRVTHTYVQTLVAPPAEVFPLLCPVREADWVPGWDPSLVISASGVAEPDCVFITSAKPIDAVWYITQYAPESGRLEMIKVTPEVTACRLTIRLSPTADGCTAAVTYSYTSLGPRGDEFIASFTEDYYRKFMHEWESSINYYLQHGTAAPAEKE